eukprot:6193387-Pleurochrysis_carterae.AAC.4
MHDGHGEPELSADGRQQLQAAESEGVSPATCSKLHLLVISVHLTLYRSTSFISVPPPSQPQCRLSAWS